MASHSLKMMEVQGCILGTRTSPEENVQFKAEGMVVFQLVFEAMLNTRTQDPL